MPKHLTILALLLAGSLLLMGAGTSHAEVSSFTYQVPEPELRTSGEHVYFGIEDFGSSTTPYYPVIPTRKVHFEIPYAATNIEVTITPGSEESMGRFENYLMRTPPLLLGVPDYQPPPAPEQIPDVIPAETFTYLGEREFRGHRLVEVVLYPIRYEAGGQITYISSYSVDARYVMAVDRQASEEMALRARSRDFEPLAAQIIENYDDMNGSLGQGAPPVPLYDLGNPQMAIITTPTFEAQAESLAAWKTKKGVPTEVYLVSWITTNYSGYDTQEKIRNFLRIDDSTPRFDYVLLMGDTNTIPDRKCWSQDGDQVPCDYYYSDVVDGTSGYDWDNDNDHVWGEFADDITWLPDIYVGRIASRSASEVEAIVDNIISYEKNPPSGTWARKAVFGAAFANYPDGYYDETDMATVAEWVRGDFLDPSSVPYERLYEADGVMPTSYTYDYPITATNFESRVGLGCGFAFPSGHGNRTGNYRMVWDWDNGNGIFDDGEDAWYSLCTTSYNPSTGDKKPYVLVGACLSGQMDATDPCLGDFIVANWGIGAVASSRTSYYCVGWDDPDWPWNQGQEYRWWEEIWANGKTRMGQIHGDNKYNYAVDFNTIDGGAYGPDQDYASRKNMFSSNLFGDPELPVWTDEAEILAVVHNSTLPTGSSPFTVTVSSGGPVQDATACLWKGTEVYLVDDTNSSGIASFTPSPSTGGTMYITVTKHNYKPYEGSATVTAGDTEDPVVTVTVPDGGESWAVDSFFDITYSATDNIGVTSIDILLSSDGGATYPHTIATGEPNTGTYHWLVDVAPTTQARVKVIAYDAAMNSGEDVSDADFTIADGTDPDVTVTVPNGGETWAIDSFFDITYSATDNIGVTSIDILLSSDGGATYPHTIATGEPNTGTYHWLVDVAPTMQARVKVIAYDAAMNSGEDVSDGNFTISDGEAPDVTVTVPNGGETWAIDSFFDVQWIATDNVGVTSIDILLSSDGGATYPHTMTTGEPNTGTYNWLVDVAPTTQARVKVIAYDAAMNSGEDASDGNFTISDGEAPDVTVTVPNGGETWAIDSFFDITYSATDNIGVTSIDILLSSDGGATYPHTMATGEPNTGTYNWLVDVAPTTQARVKVIAYDAAMNSGEDASDGNFTIADGTDPEVTVIVPNGFEVWDIGTTYDVLWTATDNIGVTAVDILLSLDGGMTFPETIATGEDNDGIYGWYVDSDATTEARIKVIAHDGGGNSGEDVSDADFEIYDPQSGASPEPEIPVALVIAGASPNPFSDRTSVRFGIPKDGGVRLVVYDVSGREVATLADSPYPAGYHSVDWVAGGSVRTGIYFLSLRFGSDEVTRKVVISQ